MPHRDPHTGMLRVDFAFVDMVGYVNRGIPFALSRFGDGEWSAILGHGSQNCDGQPYTPELRADLADVLRARPTYRIAVQDLALRRFGRDIGAWLRFEGLADLTWSGADTIHRASARGDFRPMIDALTARSVVLVGPSRLGALPLPTRRHIIVPDENAYGALDRLSDELLDAASVEGDGPVYALSAGMATKTLVHRTHAACPGHTLIDFGAVWEPYVGHANRRYHQDVLAREAVGC